MKSISFLPGEIHFPQVNELTSVLHVIGSYQGVTSGAPAMAPSSQHQIAMGSQQQQQEMYMQGLHMNGGMGSEYQPGSAVGANVQSQVHVHFICAHTAVPLICV